MDCSLPGSSVHGIFQARVLEWIAISFSRGSSQPRDRTWVSHIVDSSFTVWATREVSSRDVWAVDRGNQLFCPSLGKEGFKWFYQSSWGVTNKVFPSRVTLECTLFPTRLGRTPALTLFLAGCCPTRRPRAWDWSAAPRSGQQCLPSVLCEVSGFPPVGMMHSPGFDGSSSLGLQMLMNADSLYSAAHCALLLNLKLSHGDYYRKRPALAPSTMVSVCLPRPGPQRASGSLWAGTHCRGPERAGSAVPKGCGAWALSIHRNLRAGCTQQWTPELPARFQEWRPCPRHWLPARGP